MVIRINERSVEKLAERWTKGREFLLKMPKSPYGVKKIPIVAQTVIENTWRYGGRTVLAGYIPIRNWEGKQRVKIPVVIKNAQNVPERNILESLHPTYLGGTVPRVPEDSPIKTVSGTVIQIANFRRPSGIELIERVFEKALAAASMGLSVSDVGDRSTGVLNVSKLEWFDPVYLEGYNPRRDVIDAIREALHFVNSKERELAENYVRRLEHKLKRNMWQAVEEQMSILEKQRQWVLKRVLEAEGKR